MNKLVCCKHMEIASARFTILNFFIAYFFGGLFLAGVPQSNKLFITLWGVHFLSSTNVM